jgi:hypothetical protein
VGRPVVLTVVVSLLVLLLLSLGVAKLTGG